MEVDQKKMTIALAGNPNSGKTTLFNALTGNRQYVGNWPGVTVEKKEGQLKADPGIVIQDLPGIYSLSPYSLEERIARNYLVHDDPDVILNIVDGSNLERNLYLTSQLAELNIPLVVAVNMMDVVDKQGDRIDLDRLSKKLACPVVGISALKKKGLSQAIQACQAQAGKDQAPMAKFSKPLEKAIKEVENLKNNSIPHDQERWYAIKILEGDQEAMDNIHISSREEEIIKGILKDLEADMGDDPETAISMERYEQIQKTLAGSYHRNKKDELTTSDKVDKVLTSRILGIPIFIGIMFLMYYIAVTRVGGTLTDWVTDELFGEIIPGALGGWLTSIGASETAISLICDGIIQGIGAPIGFVPQMAMVFLFMGFLEDCGYMARVAFIMDRLFRRFGLSGKSFISFMVSSGCAVPGIMATRTIQESRDRDMTMITTCAIPCSAKLPIIALVAGYVYGGAWYVAPIIYFVSIGVVIMAGIILKKMQAFAGEPAPFVMELPAYHWPTLSGVLGHVWIRVKAFLKKAGTIIFAMSVLIWFLSSFGFSQGTFGMVEDPELSLLAVIGGFFAPLFIPIGFGNWQGVASTISGFAAKEATLSTMGVLAGLGAIEEYQLGMHAAFSQFFPTNIAAISFLMFNMYNTPCLAATATLYREISTKKRFWLAILFQNLGAWCFSLMVYQFGGVATGQIPFTGWTIVAMGVLVLTLYLLLRPDPAKKERVLRKRRGEARA